jgi:TRAP-type C4-dicarboxylate transport system permease small subunit
MQNDLPLLIIILRWVTGFLVAVFAVLTGYVGFKIMSESDSQNSSSDQSKIKNKTKAET